MRRWMRSGKIKRRWRVLSELEVFSQILIASVSYLRFLTCPSNVHQPINCRSWNIFTQTLTTCLIYFRYPIRPVSLHGIVYLAPIDADVGCPQTLNLKISIQDIGRLQSQTRAAIRHEILWKEAATGGLTSITPFDGQSSGSVGNGAGWTRGNRQREHHA